MSELPADYAERVYAGVLGKVIGVYLGRPFEGWTYERIQEKLGDVDYYVHDKLNVPLIVTDDDISGTFTFIRALDDFDSNPEIQARNIGESWLNYIIEKKSILWWGGMGNSTEHTAFLRLKNGIEAPASGSEALNGKVVAEQIGAQIFIDGWAMVAPGDADMAARLAKEAASVSHDGEAVYGAVVLAVMEAMAFVEPNINRLIDKALSYIPTDSVIAQLIDDVRKWHAQDSDWRATRELLAANYGYDKYGGNCHMVPNHGLIIHSLMHGEDDFSETMKIINTCGWDTDCNSGNVGCLMGIKNSIAGIDAGMNKGLDWRGPVADRVYLPTAEGGRGISDCAKEAVEIIHLGQRIAGQDDWAPKNGAQFHFEFSGAVQGFTATGGEGEVVNVEGHSSAGERSLQISTGDTVHCGSPVFAPDKDTAKYFENRGYALMASPRVHAGQTLSASIQGGDSAVKVSLYLRAFGVDDETETHYGDVVQLSAGESAELSMVVPADANPVFEVGIRVEGEGSVFLDWLNWHGAPDVVLTQPAHKGTMWNRAWVNAVDGFNSWGEPYRLVQNEGVGLIIQGTRDWQDYEVSADVTPHLASRVGIAARVQGLKRYYALELTRQGTVQLVQMVNQEKVLAEEPFEWTFGETHELSLTVNGSQLTGKVDGETVISATSDALRDGSIGLLIEEGRTATRAVRIQPAG
jgi:ADP-ribosylglycohydrolase